MNKLCCFIVIGAVIKLACAADSKDEGIPDGPEAAALVKAFVAHNSKPDSASPDLAGAKLITAHPLLFRAREDERPLIIHHVILGADMELGDKREWWLMSYVRHPDASRGGRAEWKLSRQSNIHSPSAVRRLTAKPTARDIEDFLGWMGWDGDRFKAFRDVQYLCFPSGWHAVTGGAPPELPGATLWPPTER